MQGISNTGSNQEPWWRGMSGNTGTGMSGMNSNTGMSMMNQLSNTGLGINTNNSQQIGLTDRAGINKEPQVTVIAPSDRGFGEKQPQQNVVSVMHPSMGEYGAPPPSQLEFTGYSITCAAPYPYPDPQFGGVMPAYGAQALVHPHCSGVARMVLPLDMTDEPVYVNAKQYHGILRRRKSRAKAELEKRLIKVRKPYLHESRHLHAMRRARGNGGRFLNTRKVENQVSNNTTEGTGTRPSSVPMPPSSVNVNMSTGYQGGTEPQVQTIQQQINSNDNGNKTYNNNGNGCYQQHHGFQLFNYDALSDTRAEGNFSGQQNERIMGNGTSNRTLTIK